MTAQTALVSPFAGATGRQPRWRQRTAAVEASPARRVAALLAAAATAPLKESASAAPWWVAAPIGGRPRRPGVLGGSGRVTRASDDGNAKQDGRSRCGCNSNSRDSTTPRRRQDEECWGGWWRWRRCRRRRRRREDCLTPHRRPPPPPPKTPSHRKEDSTPPPALNPLGRATAGDVFAAGRHQAAWPARPPAWRPQAGGGRRGSDCTRQQSPDRACHCGTDEERRGEHKGRARRPYERGSSSTREHHRQRWPGGRAEGEE